MTQNTPGTNALEPTGGTKPHHGKVVYSTDGKVLTDQDEQGDQGDNPQKQGE